MLTINDLFYHFDIYYIILTATLRQYYVKLNDLNTLDLHVGEVISLIGRQAKMRRSRFVT